jgi:hypothetical protein
MRIPRHLAIVMRVDVDPTGRYQKAASIDLTPAGTSGAIRGSDAGTVNRDVAGESRRTGTINDCAAANHEIMHLGCLLGATHADGSAAQGI